MNSSSPAKRQKAPITVVIISNGPGELSTWVKPIAENLHSKLFIRPRYENAEITLKLVLVPCPNATGLEKQAALNWNQFEQITLAKNFWKLLLNPKKYGFWSTKGLVIFLGGDQFWSVLLSARLGYSHLTYAEWVSRWPFWNDRIAAMSSSVKNKLPKNLKNRCTVVGDLMADLNNFAKQENPLPKGKWVALLPGSKKAKLCIGIPFFIEMADHLSKLIPDCNFLIPLAPTTTIQEFIYFSSKKNPISTKYLSGIAEIRDSNDVYPWKQIITKDGTTLFLEENYPAHGYLSQCDIAITTVGANTSELGALAVPMIVIIPTQHINVMEAWDGLFGLLARLPIFKWFIGISISLWRLRKLNFMAWPNISANKMIVPEKIGKIYPKEIAYEAATWLKSPERLNGMKEDLQNLRGKSGATEAITFEIIKLITSISKKINVSNNKITKDLLSG